MEILVFLLEGQGQPRETSVQLAIYHQAISLNHFPDE